MATRLHYYGSVFELADDRSGDAWRLHIADALERAAESGGFIDYWFDLRGGGLVSLRLGVDTPIAVETD